MANLLSGARVEILRVADRRARPWKNGGGVTFEIAAAPPGAGLATFDWRISTAVVAEGGPFSRFEDVDRTLLVLDGEGLVLQIADAAPATLTRDSAPLSFAGDVLVEASLVGGPVTDLNVMTRRGAWRSRVERRPATQAHATLGRADLSVLMALGALTLRGPHGEAELAAGDAVALTAGDTLSVVNAALDAELVTIDLWRER
jgi:environmental stress-induced protein Ves